MRFSHSVVTSTPREMSEYFVSSSGRGAGDCSGKIHPAIHPSLKPPARLDQLVHPHQQRDRRLPIAAENRLRLGPLHTTVMPWAEAGRDDVAAPGGR